MSNIFIKAKRAILSRMFPQSTTPQYAKDRLLICKDCLYNSLNFNDYSLMQKVKLYLNKVLNFIFRVKQFKGVCLEKSCGCTINLKILIEAESCPQEKWLEIKEGDFKSIYIPNKKQ